MTPGLLPPLVKGGPTMMLPNQPVQPGSHQPLRPQQPNNSRKKKAFTLHAWSNIPGKVALFDQLAKLKRKKASGTTTGVSGANSESKLHQQHNQGHHHQHPPHALKASKPVVKQSSTSEWLNVEKSVRFTLPPNEVKKRSGKANSRVTFIPKEDLIIQPGIEFIFVHFIHIMSFFFFSIWSICSIFDYFVKFFNFVQFYSFMTKINSFYR